MSGPKGGGYSVADAVAAARRQEQRRQALLVEYRAASQELALTLEQAKAHGVDASVGSQGTTRPDEHDVVALERAVRRLRADAAETRRSTTVAVAARVRRSALAAARSGVAEGGARRVTREDVSQWAASDHVDDTADREVDRILGELDADATEEERSVLLEFGVRVAGAAAADLQRWIAMLSDRVDTANRRIERRRLLRERAEELLMELVGIAGDEAEELRRRLRIAAEDGIELVHVDEDAVARVIARRRELEDREYATRALRESLEKLGYSVGSEFQTELMRNGSATAARSGWSEHALEVRLPIEGARIVMSAVRVGDPATTSEAAAARRDVEIEEEFCTTVPGVIEQLDSVGVQVGPLTSYAPGATAMRRVERTSASRQRGDVAEQELSEDL